MPQLNLSLHSIQGGPPPKTSYRVRSGHSVVTLATTQTHLEDLEGYQPDVSSRPLNLGPINHQRDVAIRVFYRV